MYFQPGTYVDPAINYENTAEAWARHLDKPFDAHGREFEMCLGLLQALFYDVYPETIEFIEADPDAFADRVAAYLHNMAMEKVAEQ